VEVSRLTVQEGGEWKWGVGMLLLSLMGVAIFVWRRWQASSH